MNYLTNNSSTILWGTILIYIIIIIIIIITYLDFLPQSYNKYKIVIFSKKCKKYNEVGFLVFKYCFWVVF